MMKEVFVLLPMSPLLLGLLGLPVLLLGANMIVHFGKAMAKQLGISEFFIGLTIISIGTSIPEIFTHIVSAWKMLHDPAHVEVLAGVAIGTNLGSNIVQITFIVGLVGLLSVIRTTRRFMKQDYFVMLAGIALLWWFAWTGSVIERWEGGILAVSYLGYLWYLAQEEELDDKINDHPNYHPLKTVFSMIIGLVLVIGSANVILEGATFAADQFGISGSLIGAVIIGFCTALPEFSTAVVAFRNKSNGISVGTLIGSNITNPLLGIGIGASIIRHPVAPEILGIDLPFWLAISVIGGFFFWSKSHVSKLQAALLMASYLLYLYMRIGAQV